MRTVQYALIMVFSFLVAGVALLATMSGTGISIGVPNTEVVVIPNELPNNLNTQLDKGGIADLQASVDALNNALNGNK